MIQNDKLEGKYIYKVYYGDNPDLLDIDYCRADSKTEVWEQYAYNYKYVSIYDEQEVRIAEKLQNESDRRVFYGNK